jgi:two-component system sensor histidine kinase MprB
MNLRTKFALAFAVVAGLAITAAMVLSFDAVASLLKVNTEQTYRALIDSVDTEARRRELAPPDFASPADPTGVAARVVNSRQVLAQVLDGDGRVGVADEEQPPIPVDGTDRALAADPTPGVQAEREFTVAGERFQLVTVALGGGRGAVQFAQRASETDRLLRDLRQAMLLVGLAVFVLAGVAGWLAAGRVTRRLTRLTGTAEQVAASGQFDTPVPWAGRDEVGRLSAALRTMLDRLGRAHEDQRRLLQDAGHELKTPLTSIRTNVTVLHRIDELSPGARTRLIDDLDSETRELVALANELVDLAGGQHQEEPRGRVDLAALAHQVADRATRRSDRQVVAHSAEAIVHGQPTGLERALSNLVDNAVKFAPGTEPIEIVVRPDRITVLDRGPGIAETDAARVFDRFYRASTARGLPGSGLGLAVVRKVAHAHGGTVFATRRPGGGAAIGFTLDQAGGGT